MMLNKYVYDKNLTLLAVQETGSNHEFNQFDNMTTYQDMNNQANKGCALMVHSNAMFTQFEDISKLSRNIDTVWGMLCWSGKRYIIGNVYLKLEYISGVKEFVAMLEKAHEMSKRHKCCGVIAMGDFNARHIIWNDSVINKYGKCLEETLDWSKFGVHAPSSNTFLAKNGSSLIDFFITSNDLDFNLGTPFTDNVANLYSGAPVRGHVPVTITVNPSGQSSCRKAEKKLDLKTMNWEDWTRDIELALSGDSINVFAFDDQIEDLWEFISETINKATKENCSSKLVTSHSKPYWTSELSSKSVTLRKALKSYLTRNTDSAFNNFQEAKEDFEETRKQACQNFIMKNTQNLNIAQANRFWKEFNRLFKPPSDHQVEALISDSGGILTENKDIEHELFDTFFKAKHIEENLDKFDVNFYDETNRLYSDIKENGFQPYIGTMGSFAHSSMLYCPITPMEILHTIRENKSPAESFDNSELHPSMLKHLGSNAIHGLSTLFSLCLRNGKWLWNSSNIIFLKKEGKSSYDKPGSYRPISISSYVGKLMERILARRLEEYLSKIGLLDSNQEGFSKGRNTIRYLHRLTAGIKGDILKKLTVLCLFIDFEKAFDSVWKKGLVVKLWKIGVHGCFLSTIDSFLFGRTVSLLLNGFIGPVRACLEYGLPQGSVLSPILFKFFVFDLENLCILYEQISAFKFADDGTIKVTGKDLEECLLYLGIALDSIEGWTGKWRMVVNCNVNKTEIICFSCQDLSSVPNTFELCGNTIHLTDSSKVLGITLDRKLTFKKHSQEVFNKLIYRWICMSRYANRNWGMNQRVIVRLTKTVLFSSLFYGSIIWQTNSNMAELNKLWYKVAKSAIGAVFNVQNTIAEVILGVPPLTVTGRILTVKHYLKALGNTGNDIHRIFLLSEVKSGNSTVLSQMRDVMKFVKWKAERYPGSIQPGVTPISELTDVEELFQLSGKTCHYSKGMMKLYTELLWQECVSNQLQLEGWVHIPMVSTSPLPLPLFTSREVEVLIMSLFYKNNLLNSFLFHFDRNKWVSPFCSCSSNEQTALHLLTDCHHTDEELQDQALYQLSTGNNLEEHMLSELGTVGILNCSRDAKLLQICKTVVENQMLNLRRKITLPSSTTRSTHA